MLFSLPEVMPAFVLSLSLSLFVPVLSLFFFCHLRSLAYSNENNLMINFVSFLCCGYLQLMNTSDRKSKTGSIVALYFTLNAAYHTFRQSLGKTTFTFIIYSFVCIYFSVFVLFLYFFLCRSISFRTRAHFRK